MSLLGVLKEALVSHRVQAFESVWVKASYKNPDTYLFPEIEGMVVGYGAGGWKEMKKPDNFSSNTVF